LTGKTSLGAKPSTAPRSGVVAGKNTIGRSAPG